MSKNIFRRALAPATVLALMFVLLWQRSPAQRLSRLERTPSSSFLFAHRIAEPNQIGFCGNGLEDRVDVVGEALKIVEANPGEEIEQQAAHLILESSPEDFRITALPRRAFDEKAQKRIGTLIMMEKPDPNFMLLAGIADDVSFIPTLRKWANKSVRNKNGKPMAPPLTSCSWTASLALARIGDNAAMASCLARIKSEIAADRRPIAEFPKAPLVYLDYIRRPESVELMMQYLYAEDLRRPYRNNPKAIGQIEKYTDYQSKAYFLLAKSVEGWPTPKDRFSVGSELDTISAWKQSQKQLIIKR